MSTEVVTKDKSKEKKQRVKLIIILAVEFIAIFTVLMLILFAGKKSYTVKFDLDGGILLSGDVEQRVVQGQSATPPTVAKYGHYLLGWTGSYSSVTRDVTVKAIWEYETTPGIDYTLPENSNYCLISGSYKDLQGEVYVGAYHEELKVLGIEAGAFKDRTGITAVYLLDGMFAIEEEAFAGCTSLETIEISSTVVRIGKGAFRDCTSLKEVILPESLEYLDEEAFAGCTALERVVFPDGLEVIGMKAFENCVSLTEIVLPATLKNVGYHAFTTPEMTINVYFSEEEFSVSGWEWHPEDAKFNYGYVDPVVEEETEDTKTKK